MIIKTISTRRTNDKSRDGRLKVLLILLSAILFFDLSTKYHWYPSIEEDKYNSCKYIDIGSSTQLIIKKCTTGGYTPIKEPVPTIYSPLFFHPIPINNAQKEILMSIKGVGSTLAERILIYRDRFGPFRNMADLEKLKGVGRKRALYLSTVFSFD